MCILLLTYDTSGRVIKYMLYVDRPFCL